MAKKPKKITYLPKEEKGITVICPHCGYERDVFEVDSKTHAGCSNLKCKYKIKINSKNTYRHVFIIRQTGM